MRNKFLSLFTFFLLFSLSYKTVQPLFVPGFFPMHDDTQPARVYEMAQALTSGQFPVRWVPDLGYGFGYPLFNFYGPLPYYIGAFFHLLGFDAIIATKIMFFIGLILALFLMYILLSHLVGRIGAVAISLLYLYAPYHAVQLYVRGAIGELYAYAFLPLLIYGFYNITQKKERKRGIIIGTIGLALVLISHNIIGILTLMYIIFGLLSLFCYLLFCQRSLTPFFLSLLLFFGGIGLSSFFILPAIVEKDYTRVAELTQGGSDFRNHFVYLDQLWDSTWGYGGSALGRADGMSFKVGKLHILLGVSSLPLFFLLYKKKKVKNELTVFFSWLVFILFSSLFLMLNSSRFIWEQISWFNYIQYPWRYLNFILLSLCILSSLLFLPFKKRGQLILAGIIIFFTLFLNTKYFIPREYLSISEYEYISPQNLQGKISRISDEYTPKEFLVPKTQEVRDISKLTDDTTIFVEKIKYTPTEKIYAIDIRDKKDIVTTTTYFPGWKVFIDGTRKEMINREGKIMIENIQAGRHTIRLVFTNTPIRFIGNTISFFSVFLLVYVSLFWKRKTLW